MKIYFCHSRDFDFKNELYKPIRESILNKQHEIVFPHEDDFSTVKTKDVIKTCDVVFAEVSFPATGLGIELGWADAQSVPIVCVSKAGSKVSGSLKSITANFIQYSDAKDLVEKMKKYFQKEFAAKKTCGFDKLTILNEVEGKSSFPLRFPPSLTSSRRR